MSAETPSLANRRELESIDVCKCPRKLLLIRKDKEQMDELTTYEMVFPVIGMMRKSTPCGYRCRRSQLLQVDMDISYAFVKEAKRGERPWCTSTQ